jgi:sulfane dehydrogenase subunit SoxC
MDDLLETSMPEETHTADPLRTPAPTEAPPITRRELLAGTAGAVGAAVLHTVGFATAQDGELPMRQAVQTTRRQGAGPSVLGSRSVHEAPRRSVDPISSGTPHEELHGTITPADLHYERHHGGVPEIDPAHYTLLIHGLVERPTIFTLDELKSFPAASCICFLECSGNYWRNAPPDAPPGELAPLTSQSEWTGVPLRVLLREVGMKAEATWLLAEGQDAAVMTRSIPMEKALDDALLAYAQNGEAVRPENGYPARLLLPGWEGNTSVKWLRRLKLLAAPAMSRQETARYTEVLPDGTSRQFSFVMDARSLITYPGHPKTIRPGWIEIRGIAWSGRGAIERVEVSTDGGRSWAEARLQGPVLPKAHTRFCHLWEWDGRQTQFMSRAVDETGYVQPTQREWIAARGRSAGPYHINAVVPYRVDVEGRVFTDMESWWG